MFWTEDWVDQFRDQFPEKYQEHLARCGVKIPLKKRPKKSQKNLVVKPAYQQ